MDICVLCPHCNDDVLISKLQCGVLRHGVNIKTNKQTNKPIPSHASKRQCDALIKRKLIFGCGKPFQVKLVKNVIVVSVCEYV